MVYCGCIMHDGVLMVYCGCLGDGRHNIYNISIQLYKYIIIYGENNTQQLLHTNLVELLPLPRPVAAAAQLPQVAGRCQPASAQSWHAAGCALLQQPLPLLALLGRPVLACAAPLLPVPP